MKEKITGRRLRIASWFVLKSEKVRECDKDVGGKGDGIPDAVLGVGDAHPSCDRVALNCHMVLIILPPPYRILMSVGLQLGSVRYECDLCLSPGTTVFRGDEATQTSTRDVPSNKTTIGIKYRNRKSALVCVRVGVLYRFFCMGKNESHRNSNTDREEPFSRKKNTTLYKSTPWKRDLTTNQSTHAALRLHFYFHLYKAMCKAL